MSRFYPSPAAALVAIRLYNLPAADCADVIRVVSDLRDRQCPDPSWRHIHETARELSRRIRPGARSEKRSPT